MAYDKELADAIRELLASEPDITEKKMFGGIAFLAQGNMAISASGQGGALIHVDPEDSQRIVGSTAAELAIMRGRAMPGWLRVPSEALTTPKDVTPWVQLGLEYARSLPPK